MSPINPTTISSIHESPLPASKETHISPNEPTTSNRQGTFHC